MDFAEQLRILEAAQGQPGALALALIDITFHALPESERQELKEALQAAAVPHWVTPAILAHLLEVSEDIAAERLARLRQLTVMEPFRARGEGACNVHESTRLALRQQLWSDEQTRAPFIALSTRAQQWFAQHPDPAERIEALYHRFIAEPETAAAAWETLRRSLFQPQHRQSIATVLDEHLKAKVLSGTAQAAALLAVGWWRCSRSDYPGLLGLAEQALAIVVDDCWLKADALALKGRVLAARENRRAATEALQQSLRILLQLTKRDSRNLDWLGDLSSCYNSIGVVKQALSGFGGDKTGRASSPSADLVDAARAFKDALAILIELTRLDSDNAAWQHELAVSYLNLGNVQQVQGDMQGAAKAFQRSFEIMVSLVSLDSDNTDWQRDLSVSYRKIGMIKEEQFDLDGAAQVYQHSLDILLDLLANHDPDNCGWQRDLTVIYNHLGNLKQALGELGGAEQAYRQSLAINPTLTLRDPDNPALLRELSLDYDRLGTLKTIQGDLAGAAHAFQQHLTIVANLLQRYPDNADWEIGLSLGYNNLARIKEAQGDLAGAAQAYQQALAIILTLTQRDPDNVDWQRELYVSHWNFGNLHEQQTRWNAAAEQYARALAVAEKLQQADKLNAADKGHVNLIRAGLQRVRKQVK